MNQLATIKANFTVLKSSITKLKEKLVQALEIVENVKKSLTIPEFKTKLDEILEKNPGYEKLEKVGAVLSGKTVPDIAREDLNVIASFRCALMTSVDCERAFSRLKDLLSTKVDGGAPQGSDADSVEQGASLDKNHVQCLNDAHLACNSLKMPINRA